MFNTSLCGIALNERVSNNNNEDFPGVCVKNCVAWKPNKNSFEYSTM